MKDTYNKKICWIWLTLSLGFGNEKIWKLIAENQTVEETCRYVQSHDIPNKKEVSVQTAKLVLVECLSRGYGVVCYSDAEYPKALKDIHNPPSVLYYRGDWSVLYERDILTVVGTRDPQDYTLKATAYICDGLVDEGFIIVSGLAHGVDSASQLSALRKHRPTVAVIACGLDYDYPKGANSIKDEIVAYGGLILTEYPLGQHPYRAYFPKRNRIMAGISKGTLVMEANLESGSLITAEYAETLGKKLFCLPPSNILSNRYYGQSKYIRNGATVVLHHIDIVRAFRSGRTFEEEENILFMQETNSEDKKVTKRRNTMETYQTPTTTDPTLQKPTHSYIDRNIMDIDPRLTNTQNRPLVPPIVNSVAQPSKATRSRTSKPNYTAPVEQQVVKPLSTPTSPPTTDKYANLTDDQQKVIQSISRGNTLLDDIATDTKLDISELFEIITDLEVDGLISSSFGNNYTLT